MNKNIRRNVSAECYRLSLFWNFEEQRMIDVRVWMENNQRLIFISFFNYSSLITRWRLAAASPTARIRHAKKYF